MPAALCSLSDTASSDWCEYGSHVLVGSSSDMELTNDDLYPALDMYVEIHLSTEGLKMELEQRREETNFSTTKKKSVLGPHLIFRTPQVFFLGNVRNQSEEQVDMSE